MLADVVAKGNIFFSHNLSNFSVNTCRGNVLTVSTIVVNLKELRNFSFRYKRTIEFYLVTRKYLLKWHNEVFFLGVT